MIAVSVEVAKIDKNRFYLHKERGKILDLVLIETPNSKYSDYLVKQAQSKEERERGEKGEIIGNAKILQSKGNKGGQRPPRAAGGSEDDW
jgi:hypothetical protein